MEPTLDSTTQALSRLLDPIAECFTPEVAKQVLELPADPLLQSRLDELADKSSEGHLSENEAAEYDGYIRAMDIIAVLQAKARSIVSNGN